MKTITAKELKRRLDKNEVTLIDVREPAEYKTESISGAILIPLVEISKEKLPDYSQAIVIHCRSGRRSETACEKLLKQNPSLDLYSLEGGICAWKEAGFPIKKSGCKMLPIDRQTQLAIGIIILFGTLLGNFINSGFYAIPGLIGGGLIFASLTGWCGMAKLIAKMPWNK